MKHILYHRLTEKRICKGSRNGRNYEKMKVDVCIYNDETHEVYFDDKAFYNKYE